MHKGAIKTKDGTTLLLITTTTNLHPNTTITTPTTKPTKATPTKTKTTTPNTKHHTIDNNPTKPLHLPPIKLMSLEPLWRNRTRATMLNLMPWALNWPTLPTCFQRCPCPPPTTTPTNPQALLTFHPNPNQTQRAVSTPSLYGRGLHWRRYLQGAWRMFMRKR